MTPAALLNLIRQEYNETSSDDSFIADTEIYSYMSAAEIILADRTNCTETTDSSTTTVASTADYTKPTDVMNIIQIKWNNVKLCKITLEEAERFFGVGYGGTIQEGSPSHYVEFGSQVTLYPTPDAAQTLKYWYAKVPTVLTSSSTAFSIPTQFEDYLKDYCLYRMYYKDEDTEIGDKHLRLWENNLLLAIRQWDERKNWGRVERVDIVE